MLARVQAAHPEQVLLGRRVSAGGGRQRTQPLEGGGDRGKITGGKEMRLLVTGEILKGKAAKGDGATKVGRKGTWEAGRTSRRVRLAAKAVHEALDIVTKRVGKDEMGNTRAEVAEDRRIMQGLDPIAICELLASGFEEGIPR